MASGRPRLAFVTGWLPDPEGTGPQQRCYSFLKAYARHFAIDLWFSSPAFNWEFARLGKALQFAESARFFHVELMRANVDGLQDLFNEALAAAAHVHLFKLPFGLSHKSLLWDYDELPPGLRSPDGTGRTNYDDVFQRFSRTCRLRFCASTLETSAAAGHSHVVPNCYHVVEARTRATPPGSTLLFTGTLGYGPNVGGLNFFAEQVMPLLPPHVRLTVVGRKPQKPEHQSFFTGLAADPRVSVHYDVPSCSPFYDRAAAAIVPLQEGSGTRLKILEAFAHRCPVVSTAKGCEGLGVRDGQELLVRDVPQGFAAACMDVLRNAPQRQTLTDNALRHLRENNSQAAVERALDEALSSAGILPPTR